MKDKNKRIKLLEEELQKNIEVFESIRQKALRTYAGNVTHSINNIAGIAQQRKYLSERLLDN